jgi:hypothetical protein
VYSGRCTHSLRSRILLDSIFCLLGFPACLLIELSGFACGMPRSCLCSEIACYLLKTRDFDRVGRHGTQSHEAAFESCGSRLRNLCLFAARWRFDRRLQKDRVLYARMKSQPGFETWLLMFRLFCKHKPWIQHASTQPPSSGLKFVARSYNVGSVLLLVGCGGGCTQAVGPTRL